MTIKPSAAELGYLPMPPQGPKMLRETLCWAQQMTRKMAHRETLQFLIDHVDQLRPLGPDGTHGNRHTDFCGCGTQERLNSPATLYEAIHEILKEENPHTVNSAIRQLMALFEERYVDPDPSQEFPYTVFDSNTGEILDRAISMPAGYALGFSLDRPVQVMRTWGNR